MSTLESSNVIAVVIATRDRFRMLSERAIPSVLAQSRTPDLLVVVDDSVCGTGTANAEFVRSLARSGCEIVYRQNNRTPGASGAWNTALEFLVSRGVDPALVFVAVLDDDDQWSPVYLESCLSAARGRQLDMVAADLRRFESVGGEPVLRGGPLELRAEDFLTGNPGIQGSNLFIRLSVLLAAGGFDEALRSTTDRDLCIRIADMGTVRYGRLPVALVDHFADGDRWRLSTRGSEAKADGLAAFWRKYSGRMSADQRSVFSGRTQALFGWSPPSVGTLDHPNPYVGCDFGGGQEDPVRSMPAIIAPIGSAAPEAGSEGERVREAGQRMMDVFPRKRFWLLGRGSEAVVFTDGSTVYKVFDYWKTSMSRAQIRFLQGQTGRWGDAPGLYALRDVVEYGTTLILTYDYESSVPYEGGRESDLIRLLDGCRAVGIVCNNVHPKNLIVTPSGVKLIDYGSDIRPWNPLGFEHMARRAFLACRHAGHRDLPFLMGRALRDTRFPEMADYGRFRAKLDGGREPGGGVCVPSIAVEDGACRQCPRMYVGIISSDPTMLGPLLECLASLRDKCAQEPVALVLDNGSPTAELDALVRGVRDQGLQVAVVDEAQQRGDAASGGFGAAMRDRPRGQVGIARARTMLQRYLGTVMATDAGSFGWVLDDDMRVDDRALAYLPWLPFFREQGTSVLIGAYEGASPNPLLNGLRVQLLDIYHNIHWLKSLPGDAILPDRSEENAALRRSYPDYYYDLSRKHTAHLEMPHWLEPIVPGERVSQAYSRLVAGSLGILCGTPLTRPIVSTMPTNPLASAKDSVNRGGCTFILNHRALTETPNLIPRVRGREARRSDMVWAILNRHYRRMTIKAVAFPVHHVGRVSLTPSLDIDKVQGEIVGSTLYGAMSEFLRTRSYHELDLSSAEIEEICHLADRHLERRWRMLEHSFHRIAGLREAIRAVGELGELRQLVAYLDEWFTPETLDRIRLGVGAHDKSEIRQFLASLRAVSDDYASGSVSIGFIRAQLRTGGVPTGGKRRQ